MLDAYGDASLCWSCQKAVADRQSSCCWSRVLIPVDAWNVIEDEDGVNVITCPEYMPDDIVESAATSCGRCHDLAQSMHDLDYDLMRPESYRQILNYVGVAS